MNARLELLRRRIGSTGPVRTGVPPRPNQDTAPLSAAQYRMWLHQELHPGSSSYNVSIRIDLTGDLDEERLLDAIAEVVNRHEVLRTTYPIGKDGQPYQRIHARLPYPVHIVESDQPNRVAQEAASEPFDIASSSPIRIHLIRVAPRFWSLVLTVHHIVWDGGCFGVFSHDLSLAYRGQDQTSLSIQYADIAAHQAQNDAIPAAHIEEQLEHWRQTLTPPPPAVPLPTARALGPDLSERAIRMDRDMPASCASGLRATASDLRTTPFAVFMAAYALLLRRWTGTPDVTIGTMVANRHQPGSRNLIGNFGNTVLLRIDFAGHLTFRQLMARTTQVISGALSNADVPFEQIVADLAPPREPGHGLFTDTLGLFLDRDIEGPDLPGVDAHWENVPTGSSPFALTFQGFLTGDLLRVEATFRSEAFEPDTIRYMLDHLETILLTATAAPDSPCAVVGRLTDEQRQVLLQRGTGANIAAFNGSVLTHWRRLAAASPDRTALVHGLNRFSYAEIDGCANRLAARLIAHGVSSGDVVGVAVGRGKVTVVAPLAIWKCGAVYLPLDPRHPRARLDALLNETNARLAIRDADVDTKAGPSIIADEGAWMADQPATDPGYDPQTLDAAHIGFTSGSTGQPRGVVTTHGSLAARTSWVETHWPSGTGSARLAKSAPTAIDATAELCEAFVTGECLVLASDEEARDAAALARLLSDHTIGHFMAVPGLIEATTVAAPEVIASRDRVLSTGEPLLPSVARTIYMSAPTVSLYNSYGCTETTGDVAAGRVAETDARGGSTPIGTPLPGSRIYVLDEQLSLAPPGVLGELYVEGAQLAREYLGQSAFTATRFIANPFSVGGRLYRTGDLARWRTDGRLELAGRVDDQVNVRGHRVEPAETVEALHALPNVREAAVLPRAVGSTIELVAYVVGEGLGPEDEARLRDKLARTLPGPLVPAQLTILTRLPRLQGGKIDRQALLRNTPVTGSQVSLRSRAPQNEREAALVRLLGEVLGQESVGVDDDFFALGGDSLLAVIYAARANAAGMAFPAAAVFQYPTVAQLVRELAPPKQERAKPLSLPPNIHRFRLSGIRIDELITWEALGGPIPVHRLRELLTETIRQHAPLRQAVAVRGRLWRVTQLAAPLPETAVVEVSTSDLAEALEGARSTIDLAEGRVLVGLAMPESTLLVAHPVAIDGLSLARIASDIEARLKTGNATRVVLPKSSDADAFATATVLPSHWDAVTSAGPASLWWIGSEKTPPPGPRTRARATTDTTCASAITKAFLRATLVFTGEASVIADVEVVPQEIGPLLAVPVAASEKGDVIVGDSGSYLAYLSGRRPAAGGPGILVRRTVAPDPEGSESIVRGADRLYRLVASWQRQTDQVLLEVAAQDTGIAEELATTWASVLSNRDGANA